MELKRVSRTLSHLQVYGEILQSWSKKPCLRSVNSNCDPLFKYSHCENLDIPSKQSWRIPIFQFEDVDAAVWEEFCSRIEKGESESHIDIVWHLFISLIHIRRPISGCRHDRKHKQADDDRK
jgi:hypothetical protein